MSRIPLGSLWTTLLCLSIPTPAAAQTADLISIALAYVAAQERVMEADASPVDVDSLLAFVTDDFLYLHPAANARIEGRASARAGILSHLGETADAAIRVSTAIEDGGAVTLVTRTSFRTRDGEAVDRGGTSVFLFRDRKIALRADF